MTALFSYLQQECNLQQKGSYWFGGTSDFDSLCYFPNDNTWYQFSRQYGGRYPAALHFIGGVPWHEAYKAGDNERRAEFGPLSQLNLTVPKNIELPKGRLNVEDEYILSRGVTPESIVYHNITSSDEAVFTQLYNYKKVHVGTVQRNKLDADVRQKYITHLKDGATKLWPMFDLARHYNAFELIVTESIWSALRINQMIEHNHKELPIRAIALCGCGFTVSQDRALQNFTLWACGDYGRGGKSMNTKIENRQFGRFGGTITVPRGFEVDEANEDFVNMVTGSIMNARATRQTSYHGTSLQL